MNKVSIWANKIQDSLAKPLKTRPLAVFSILAFIFVIMRLYFSIEPLLLFALFIILLFVCLNQGGKIDKFITVFLSVSMLLGIFYASYKISSIQKLNTMLDGQFVKVVGVVASVPEKGKYSTTFFFDCDKGYSHKGEFDGLKIYVKCDNKYSFKFGDRLVFNADIESAESANIKFSKHYLAKGAPFVADNIVLLDKRAPSLFYNTVAVVRNYIIDIGNEFFTNDARELLKALTAGDKTGFSESLTSSLNKSGLSHIACVSGLHVSILGMAVLNLLKKRNKALAAILALVVVYVFAFITGATPSALRAAMMFTSFVIAKTSLRDNDGFTSLCFSAMVLALINPYVIYDWGIILSFLSVLGIQIFSFYFKNLLSFLPETLADSIAVTMSAQLLTIPATANMFGYISTYSIFANIIISMVFLWVLYLCFIFIALSFMPGVNWFVSVICTFGLDIVAAVAKFFADLPGSVLMIDQFDVVEFIVYYSLVMMFVFRKKLSAYFISAVIFASAVLLVVTAFVPISHTYKYTIADESSLFVKEDKTVLLATDTLWEIQASLDDANSYTVFDDVVLAGDVTGQENAVIDMRKSIRTLHISEEYKNSSFANIAQRMRIEVEYYTKGTDLDKCVAEILK